METMVERRVASSWRGTWSLASAMMSALRPAARPFVLAAPRLVVAAALVALGAACAELEPFPGGVCGNGILEADEECDPGIVGRAGCGAPSDPLRACRPICAAATALEPEVACGAGSRCGDDGICRSFSGQLAAGTPVVLGRAIASLELADFDADRVPDLMMATGRDVFLAYGDGDGGFAAPDREPLSALRGMPFAFSLNPRQDAARDLVVPIRTGALVLAGSSTRRLDALAFDRPVGAGSDAYVLRVPAPDWPTDFTVTLRREGNSFCLSIGEGRLVEDERCEVVPATRGLAPREPILAADLDDDGRPEIVVPMERREGAGRRDLVVVLTFEPRAERSTQTLSSRVIEVPGTLQGQLLVGDVDGDRRLDLVTALEPELRDPRDGPAPVFVARTSALGGIEPFARHESLNFALGAAIARGASQRLVAAGDLTGDGLADFVAADDGGDAALIYAARTAGSISYADVTQRLLGPVSWREARIGDVNGDAVPDLVALAADGAVEVLLGNGRGAFNPQRYPTFGVPELLRLGDVDGDRIVDVLFVEALRATRASISSLVVMFGQSDGYPSPPLDVGTFDGVATGVELTPVGGSDLPFDAIDDVLVRTVHDGTAPTVTDGFASSISYVFYGSADRSLRAPKPLGAEPVRVFAGDFRPAREGAELIGVVREGLTTSPTLGVRLVSAAPRAASTSTASNVFDAGFGRGSVETVTPTRECGWVDAERLSCADVTTQTSSENGRDVLWMFWSARCKGYGVQPGALGVGIRPPNAGLRIELDDDDTLTCTPVARADEAEGSVRVRAAALTGDATQDLLVATPRSLLLYVDPLARSGGALGAPRSLPLPAGAMVVDVAVADLDVDGKLDVVALVTTIETDRDGTSVIRGLVVLSGADDYATPRPLFEVGRVAFGATGFVQRGMAASSDVWGSSMGAPASTDRLLVDDLDRDGLVDLVIEQEGTVRPLRAVSRSARDAASYGAGLVGGGE
jgi:hypothetical protein